MYEQGLAHDPGETALKKMTYKPSWTETECNFALTSYHHMFKTHLKIILTK